MNVRPIPCQECPWVRSTPPGKFPASRYAELRGTTGTPGNEAPIGSALFACHLTQEGKELPCAGWLAAVGYYSLPVRILAAEGEIPGTSLRPADDWPDLFDSYAEMEAAQGG